MEKERKGLFERLMDFWKEKIYVAGEDRIGFWYEKDPLEEDFAEMGTMADVSRKEMQKNLFPEKEEKRQMLQEMFSAEKAEEPKKKASSIFVNSVQMFKESEEAERGRNTQVLLWEMPEAEKEKRAHVEFAVQKVKMAEQLAEEKEEDREMSARIEQQKTAEIDVEKLMQQITKKLWEEREGCGRRLR